MEKFLGIELGSTRIKSVLIDKYAKVLAQGSFQWENQLENGLWTYSLENIEKGVKECMSDLTENFNSIFEDNLDNIQALGCSAMMHGYLVFDKEGNLLTPFRTWRNTNTVEAAKILIEKMNFNIPLRWSIAHLYQAILDNEEHVKDIDYITTLSGYVHWKLTGQKVLGIGDASGMFPIDSSTKAYDQRMVDIFNDLIKDKGFSWTLLDILPKVLVAGNKAGQLTKDGIEYLGGPKYLAEGTILAPPEGDAGTGMIATNAITIKTGNVSAGTSIFAMIVLDKPLKNMHEEVDAVTTPDGKPVAMVHCNNCTSDIDAWSGLFHQFSRKLGLDIPITKVYELIYDNALKGESNCGGLMAYNYISGEPTIGLINGCPLFMRQPDAIFSFENFARTHIYSSVATLKIGIDILLIKESVQINKLFGHGGFFTTKGVGQKIMADILKVPIAVMQTAGEGGPWGMAVLSSYMKEQCSLDQFLSNNIFKDSHIDTISPNLSDEGVDQFMNTYVESLVVEKQAVSSFIDRNGYQKIMEKGAGIDKLK